MKKYKGHRCVPVGLINKVELQDALDKINEKKGKRASCSFDTDNTASIPSSTSASTTTTSSIIVSTLSSTITSAPSSFSLHRDLSTSNTKPSICFQNPVSKASISSSASKSISASTANSTDSKKSSRAPSYKSVNSIKDSLETTQKAIDDSIDFPITPSEQGPIQEFILTNFHINKNTNIILRQFKNLLSDEQDFASLYKNNWLTCGIIQDFLGAIFHDEKDRKNNTPCYLIHNTFYHFLTQDNKYTYSAFHTRHLNDLHLKGDIAFIVHVPGHWLISVISFVNKQIIVLDPMNTQRHSTKIAENLKLFVRDEYNRLGRDSDINEWEIITAWPNISMQTNGYSCGIFASVRLQFWCIHRRFPTAAEFNQNDDDRFRLYMVKRILQYHRQGCSSILYLLNKRRMVVHELTADERNVSLDLTIEEIETYLL